MRSGTRFVTVLACVTAISGLAGCGGGGTEAPAEVTGVWTGNFATRTTGTIEVDFTRTGSNLTGTVRLTLSGTVYTGSLTGSISNNQVTATVVYDQGYGTVNYTATISGSTLSGTYTRGTESGTVSLNKNVGVQTSSISGTYTGTSTDTGKSPKSLSVTFTQTGDTFTGSYSSNGKPAVQASGTVIGPTVTSGVILDPNSGLLVNFTGTVSADGNTISGTYVVTNGSQSGTGTWTVTKQS